jgi:hypothetical protein
MIPISKEDEDEFMREFGRAFLKWQYVEAKLYLLFTVLIAGREEHIVSAAYHSVSGFSGRLGMIGAGIKVGLAGTQVGRDWKALKKRIEAVVAKRNLMGHGVVLGKLWWNETRATVLSESLFDTRYSGKRQELHAEDLRASAAEFEALADEVQAYVDRVRPELWWNKEAVIPTAS